MHKHRYRVEGLTRKTSDEEGRFIEAVNRYRKDPQSETLIGKLSEAFCVFVTKDPIHHFFHNHRNCDEVMAIFSLTADIPIVNETKIALESQLSTCTLCVEWYHKCLRSFNSKALELYGKEITMELNNIVRHWDLKRILSQLSKLANQVDGGIGIDDLRAIKVGTVPALFEILNYPQYLEVKDVDSHFTKLILDVEYHGGNLMSKSGETFSAGVLVLMGHVYKRIRIIGLQSLENSKTKRPPSPHQREMAEVILNEMLGILVDVRPIRYNLTGDKKEVAICIYRLMSKFHTEL